MFPFKNWDKEIEESLADMVSLRQEEPEHDPAIFESIGQIIPEVNMVDDIIDETVRAIMDVIDGTSISTSAWDQQAPHSTLRVIQDRIKENIREMIGGDDWTTRYRWVPRHVTLEGDIRRGLEDIKMSAKARKEIIALLDASVKPERGISYSRDPF
jgi:hypothetical protein